MKLSKKQKEIFKVMKEQEGLISVDNAVDNPIINTYKYDSDSRHCVKLILSRMESKKLIKLVRPGVYQMRGEVKPKIEPDNIPKQASFF